MPKVTDWLGTRPRGRLLAPARDRRKSPAMRWILVMVAATCAIAACTGGGPKPPAGPAGASGTAAGGAGPPGATKICGQPILLSPWNYDGKAGTYTASNAPRGLPTFGSAKADFPSAREIIVVPAGDNTVAAERADYQVSNAVVYFEPGVHKIEDVMYTGHNSAYVGG